MHFYLKHIYHLFVTLLFIVIFIPQTIFAQNIPFSTPDIDFNLLDSTLNPKKKKRPFMAASKVIALNTSIWLFDRYILQGDYAYIDLSTMKNNLKTGFVWDNDSFSTNLLFHPYHGSLYYNAARSNGLNFYESTPYAFGGSLMWELFMENEPPSINDLFSTTFGGIALGEVTYRISSSILDDTKTGGNRVTREFLGALISPMRAITRMTNGDMWKRRNSNSFIEERSPISMFVSTGWRYLAGNNQLFRGDNTMLLDIGLTFGNPFDHYEYKPFDYFALRSTFNIIGNQPKIASVNVMGMLWGKSVDPLPEHEMTMGIFQHFDYYQTDTIVDSSIVPFEIAQTAAFGLGLIYRFPKIGQNIDLSYSLYTNAILMGGILTDHFTINDRNYNMGSGFSLKFQTMFNFGNKASFFLGLEHYSLFSWKGYPNEPNPLPKNIDIKTLNAQGNKGHYHFSILNPRISINVNKTSSVSLESSIYTRNSIYEYFEEINYVTFENRLTYTFYF